MKTITVAITGGIAGYKVKDLIMRLKDEFNLEVIMTQAAVAMFPISDFEKILKKKIFTQLVEEGFDYHQVLTKKEVDHVKIADNTDLFIIAPATANIIAKLAHGIADDLLTTTLLCATSPVLLCPSMNIHMWENFIVQENISKLKSKGYYFLNPSKGELACGYKGVGRLADIKKITKEAKNILLKSRLLKGKKIIITAGATREYIDAVRVVTNKGSGKMGVALANECAGRGGNMLLLKSKTSPRSNVAELIFESTTDLYHLLKKNIPKHDIIIHTASVSDFIPEKKAEGKIESRNNLSVKFHPSPKIISRIKNWNPNIILVGFKAVYKKNKSDIVKIGSRLLKVCHADYIVVNDVAIVGSGFESDFNEVTVITQNGKILFLPKAPKIEIASQIIDFIVKDISI